MINGFQARDYQEKACAAAFEQWDEHFHKSTLIVLPTGTGKTKVAADIACKVIREYEMSVLFLAHRKNLIRQAVRTIAAHGLDVEVEMAGEIARMTKHPKVVVATVQTLQGDRLASWRNNYFGLIVTDEAHHSHAKGYQAIRDHFLLARHLGITATPEGGKKAIFDSLAFKYSMTQAVKDGWLVPIKAWEKCKVQVDLRKLKVTAGDFSVGDLGERISNAAEHIASGISQRIGDRKTLVFCPDVGSSQALAAALRARTQTKKSVNARYVAGTGGRFGMPEKERNQIMADFEGGKFNVLTCCELLVEGYDFPPIDCVVIARPTLQLYRAKQMIGRGTRISPETSKENLLVVDFDWQADPSSRDIVTEVDFVAAEDPDLEKIEEGERKKILKAAKKIWAKGETAANAIDKSKRHHRSKVQIPVFMKGAEAKFDIEIYNPLSVSQLLGLKRTNWDVMKGNRYPGITESQALRLRKEGVVNVDNMTKFAARRMIDEIEKQKRAGRATVRQIATLRKLGVGEMTARCMPKEMASDRIEELSMHKRNEP